jgi:hypothetical protein
MQFNLRSTFAVSVCGLLLVLAAPSGTVTRAETKEVAATEVLTVGVLSDAVPDSHADTDSHLVDLDLMAAQTEENRDAQFTWERDRDGIDVNFSRTDCRCGGRCHAVTKDFESHGLTSRL